MPASVLMEDDNEQDRASWCVFWGVDWASLRPVPPEATKMCVGGGGSHRGSLHGSGGCHMSESTIQVTTFLTSSVSTDGFEEGFLWLLMEKIWDYEQITVWVSDSTPTVPSLAANWPFQSGWLLGVGGPGFAWKRVYAMLIQCATLRKNQSLDLPKFARLVASNLRNSEF